MYHLSPNKEVVFDIFIKYFCSGHLSSFSFSLIFNISRLFRKWLLIHVRKLFLKYSNPIKFNTMVQLKCFNPLVPGVH